MTDIPKHEIDRIAGLAFNIATLDGWGSPALDYYELHVDEIRGALRLAWAEGAEPVHQLLATVHALLPLAESEVVHLTNTDCVEEADAAWTAIDAAHRLIARIEGGRP